MAILIDTSCLYALTDSDDQYHVKITKFVQETRETIIVPSVVLPEISYLVNKYLGTKAEIAILSSIKEGQMKLEELNLGDLERIIELISKYREQKIGLVDAAIVALAERLKITTILTLDQRHFSLFRPKHAPAFTLYPS